MGSSPISGDCFRLDKINGGRDNGNWLSTVPPVRDPRSVLASRGRLKCVGEISRVSEG